jgi:hypothetical protein
VPLEFVSEKNKIIDDSGILIINDTKIPNDYNKPFAVSARAILQRVLDFGFEIVQEKRYTPYIDGKEKFARVLVQKI